MDRNLVLLNQNIARLRRDVRLQTWEIEQLIAADIDCTSAAQRLMRMQADLGQPGILPEQAPRHWRWKKRPHPLIV
jgi:hypothetical protein